MKCHVPAKNESKTWTKYIPTNCRSCLDWYFCDRKSEDYPLRDVSGQGKPEPHYEDGTFNACAKCNQQYLNKAKKNGDSYLLSFAGEMTIYTAKGDFSKLFSKPVWLDSNITIDLSDVVEMDTSGAQLLLILVREMAEGGVVTVNKVSDAAESVITLLNLKSHLGMEFDTA